MQRLLEGGYRFARSEQWTTSAAELPELGEALLTSRGESHVQVVVETDGTLSLVGLYPGGAYASVAAASDAVIDERLAALRQGLPAPDPSSAHEVTVTFWTYSPHGPMPSWRSISVPDWTDIRANYAASTREGLESLMQGFRPAHGGQLVLWHGEAGTGKTFALRALAWEWREWCSLYYIVDPDSFFGQHADYLMNVLLQPGWEGMTRISSTSSVMFTTHDIGVSEPMMLEDGEGEGHPEKGWRLLVLEDTGELLTPDAKTNIGQGLSRFLNVVDGLIGQGLRVLVLVTTNEEIRKLHPAVARPGRCAANIAFGPLSAEEASAWLAEREVDAAADGATTIASLYALAEDFGEQKKPSVGFAE